MQLIAFGYQDLFLYSMNEFDIYIDKYAREIGNVRLDANFLCIRDNLYITNINLQSLQKLTEFSCKHNDAVINITNLPQSLKRFTCMSAPMLSCLPTWPTELNSIILAHLPLTCLPDFPEKLEYLYCNNLCITTLPKFSDTLTSISLSNLLLTSVPQLPANLHYFYCEYSNIKMLPTFPETTCSINLEGLPWLYSLPVLPTNLKDFSCIDTAITTIPALPNSLQVLCCHNNNLTYLPILPKYLERLECEGNCLIELPDLPNSLRALSWPARINAIYPKLQGLYDNYMQIDNNTGNYTDDEDDNDNAIVRRQQYTDARLKFIHYVNEVNSQMRVQSRTKQIKSDIMRLYAERTMAPANLMPLLENPDMDIDEFMESLIANL